MKRLTILLIIVFSISIKAQFKTDSDKKDPVINSITNYSPSSLFLGFLNPDNFTIRHSVGMSYTSFGNNGIALGSYTGSIGYAFSDKLNVQVDASLVTSPYSSFGDQFSKDISGLYLNRAAINYAPSENTKFILEFRQIPYGYYNRGYYGPFGYGFYD